MRALGSRLADCAGTRSDETIEFAKRFTEDRRFHVAINMLFDGKNTGKLVVKL